MTARHLGRRRRRPIFDILFPLTFFGASVIVSAAFLDWSIL